MSGGWVKLPPLRREKLPNGLTLIVAERPTLPLVTMRLALRAGSSHDPSARAGLSAFTARLLRHGAGERDARQFAEDLDAIGGAFGASIGLDQLTVDAEFTTETLDAGRALFLDALLKPRFEESELARERERAIAEVEQSHDDPEHVADRAFQRFLFEGHAYGHPAEGTARSLAATTREDVTGFRAHGIVPDGGALVVVGDVSADDELPRLREALAAWPGAGAVPQPPADAPAQRGRRVVLVHDEGAAQAQWRAGNVGHRRLTPHYHRLVLANSILGGAFTSRLMQAIRVERGLTYGIGSRFLLGLSRGPFAMSSFTKNSTLAEMHGQACELLASFRRQGVTRDELEASRAYVLGLHVRRFEAPEGLAAALADAEIFGLGEDDIAGFRRGIEAVTLDELNASLPEIFPEDVFTVVTGDAEALKDACASLGEVHVVDAAFAEGMEP